MSQAESLGQSSHNASEQLVWIFFKIFKQNKNNFKDLSKVCLVLKIEETIAVQIWRLTSHSFLLFHFLRVVHLNCSFWLLLFVFEDLIP